MWAGAEATARGSLEFLGASFEEQSVSVRKQAPGDHGSFVEPPPSPQFARGGHPFSGTVQGAVVGAKEEERVTPGVLAMAGGGGPANKGLALSPAFFPCGCHNKVPQIGWLKTTEIESLTVLEASNLK